MGVHPRPGQMNIASHRCFSPGAVQQALGKLSFAAHIKPASQQPYPAQTKDEAKALPLKHGDHGGVVLRLLALRKILTMPSIYEDWLFQALGLFALDVLSFAHLADLDKLRASAVAGPAARRRACRNPNHQAVVSEQPDSLAGLKYCATA